MADPFAEPRTKRFDLLAVIAAGFFLLAVALAGVPALQAGPATLAGLLLLAGLAGVAFLGLMAFRASARPAGEDDLTDTFIEALPEAAVVAGADGRILACNGAWQESVGPMRRLPKGQDLFSALVKARKGETAEAAFRVGVTEHPATVSPLGAGRVLVRLRPSTQQLRLTADNAQAASDTAAAPQTLDAFAAASPFGAALLDGVEVFGAKIMEVNPALTAMTSGAAKEGAVFGDLIAPASHVDAALGAAEGASGPIEVRLAHDPTRIAH
ncbi:MAG TPA: hybrid sensor histidine kinase/response regulator, partial [Caulobacteraceae bacterium]|nr:hybrid sensor histidine kinase/response regulator [Caulobacteraceae bacterium]